MSRWMSEINYIMFLSKLLQWPEWHSEKQSNFPVVVYKTPGDQDIAYFSSHILLLLVPHQSTQIPILWPHQAGNSLFTYGEFHLCMHYMHKYFLLNIPECWPTAQTKSTPDSIQSCYEVWNGLGSLHFMLEDQEITSPKSSLEILISHL